MAKIPKGLKSWDVRNALDKNLRYWENEWKKSEGLMGYSGRKKVRGNTVRIDTGSPRARRYSKSDFQRAEQELKARTRELNDYLVVLSSDIVKTSVVPGLFLGLLHVSPYDTGRLISYWTVYQEGSPTVPFPLKNFTDNGQYVDEGVTRGMAQARAWENMLIGLKQVDWRRKKTRGIRIANITPYLWKFPELVQKSWLGLPIAPNHNFAQFYLSHHANRLAISKTFNQFGFVHFVSGILPRGMRKIPKKPTGYPSVFNKVSALSLARQQQLQKFVNIRSR